MNARVVVNDMSINDGTCIPVPPDGVILFVGPNNAGKSQALRDISALATDPNARGVVVSTASIDYRGDEEDLRRRFDTYQSIVTSGPGSSNVVLGGGHVAPLPDVISWWTSMPHAVAMYFVLHADTESRLTASHPVESLDLYQQTPSHPLHRIYSRRDLESRLDAICRDAFGQGLILDVWAGGSQWSLRIGDLEQPDKARPDQEYLDALRELPLLHAQGDGVRSMIGLLLDLLTGPQSLSLIDEPEAFLHPPQARYLARLLSEDAAATQRTAFVSTHSTDVVHGLLEGPAEATVVRLQRSGERNEAAVIDNKAVRRLWTDPLLRYSRLLEGLFTDAVVICESDADCKFFASIKDTFEFAEKKGRKLDVLFTSCGGKHRLHVGVEALRAASVPVAVIGDFDVLNDWTTLANLITKAGGNAEAFEVDWNILNSSLIAQMRTPSIAGVKEAVTTALDQVAEVSTKALAPVREALKIENGWSRVKNAGLAGVPKGDPYQAANRILEGLRDLRIHLIEAGEMEDFVPEASGHGPAWLTEVLERRLHQSSSGDRARNFLREVISTISSTQ